VTISKENRTKKKAITQVAGLDMFGIYNHSTCFESSFNSDTPCTRIVVQSLCSGLRLKDVAKVLGKKFACGCSVVEGSTPGSEEIAIQGDFQYELADYIAEKMPEVCLC
jgi:translation initiation factor 1 (eIF-1/SUI1)